jgi:hypothetical protein
VGTGVMIFIIHEKKGFHAPQNACPLIYLSSSSSNKGTGIKKKCEYGSMMTPVPIIIHWFQCHAPIVCHNGTIPRHLIRDKQGRSPVRFFLTECFMIISVNEFTGIKITFRIYVSSFWVFNRSMPHPVIVLCVIINNT